GCTHPVDYRSEDYAARVRELTGGEGVDLVLDPLGGRDWKRGLGLLRPVGQLIAYGFANLNTGAPKPTAAGRSVHRRAAADTVHHDEPQPDGQRRQPGPPVGPAGTAARGVV